MPRQRRPNASGLLFGRTFLRHPKMLGSAVPSSRFLISRVRRQADWSGARVVVEAGPGVGTLTTAILDRQGGDGTLVAFEMNSTFVAHLRRRIGDPRLTVLHRPAAEAEPALAQRGIGPGEPLGAGSP